MIQLRAPGPNPVRIRPVQPSAALKVWYESELDKLIEPMCEDVVKALLPIWHDAPKPTLFMTFPHDEMKYELAEIGATWQRKFAEAAPALAHGIAKRVLEYYDTSFADALTKAGIGIPKPTMDSSMSSADHFKSDKIAGTIEMSIEQFLKMALPTATEGGVPEKLGRVRATLARGEKFSFTPHLTIVDDKVVGHEGRHRAMVLREMGYTTIPVRLKVAPQHGSTLQSQDGKNTMPFPAMDLALGMDDKKKDFRVKFDFTERLQATAQAHIDENIKLIHSIPEQFHRRIKRMAWKSIENGRDIAGFTKDLQDEFDITLRRAAFIASDQNNKMTAMFHRTRRLDLGLTTAIWRHTNASLHPREEHIDFDGELYSNEEGMCSEESGENIWPGTEPHCGCVDETVIPGYGEN